MASPDEPKPSLLGETLLHQAVLNNDISLAVELLDAGIDKNRSSSYGETPLYYAVAGAIHELVSLLLRAGADKNIANHKGETPLSRAIKNGHAEVVMMLLIDGMRTECPQARLLLETYPGYSDILQASSDVDCGRFSRGSFQRSLSTSKFPIG